MMLREKLSKILTFSIFLLILIFSFYFNFESGRRGFFPLDQSIIFDGSYRILKGQIPYKDFLIPVGPVPFYIHSLFFKIFGLSYWSYLLGSSLINLLATISSFFIIYIFFPSKKWLSFVGAILTAIWFYPPSGTPYIEHTSFFLSLLGIFFILISLYGERISKFSREIFLFLSGFLALLSILCKQNFGFFILPIYFLLILSFHISNPKKILSQSLLFLTGLIIGIFIFVALVIKFSDLNLFFKYFFKLPFETGLGRFLPKNFFFFLSRMGPLSILPFILLIFSASLFSIILYIYNFQKADDELKRLFVSSTLCSYLIISQYLFLLTTKNQPEMGLFFIGIIFSIGVGIIIYLTDLIKIKVHYKNSETKIPSKIFIKRFLLFLFLIFGFYIAFKGVNISLTRKAHDIFDEAVFKETLSVKEFKFLKWGEPTSMRGANVKKEEIESLINFLKWENKNFFIFPDFTILYGILNFPSPQPLLWFHKGLTYPYSYDKSLDNWIVESLKKNNVKIIVIEESSWFGTEERLRDFPLLISYIEKNFIGVNKIGIFSIYRFIEE